MVTNIFLLYSVYLAEFSCTVPGKYEMYFVCFQRVMKSQEEFYQFIEGEWRVFLLSGFLYRLV